MAELNTAGVQSPSTSPSPSANVAVGTEHLTKLPKMSATAGVGTTEYVAVNVTAVNALTLGIASVLVLINDMLGAIAIAGVVTSLIALRQINNSNGTQAGAGMAMTGLAVAVAVGFFVIATNLVEASRTRADRQAISNVCDQFGQYLAAGNYDAAYDLFSVRFKTRISKDDFTDKMKLMQDQFSKEGGPGPLIRTQWNGLIRFNIEPDSGVVTAIAPMKLQYQRTPYEDLTNASFRKSLDRWLIDSLPDWFPPPKVKMPGQPR